ncbi:MAG: ATP-grasp domain-containing protein [Pirellulaceae bacterium]
MYPLVIVGTSVRAAAASAVKAGLSPLAIDAFADADLLELCPVLKASGYPDDVTELASRHPPAPWMYTGALENRPDILRALSATRPLLGNGPHTVASVRDPWQLAATLRRADVPFPALRRASDPPRHGLWMRKPLLSGGGRQLVREAGRPDLTPCSTTHYWQEWQPGEPLSALYIGGQPAAQLLGVTRQLIGLRWTGARGFEYCGSIGPLPITAAERSALMRLGDALTRHCRLVGLFGVDFLRNSEGLWPVEVNPRYTASVEVWERATGEASLKWHVRACRRERLPAAVAQPLRVCGKAIFYAPATAVVTPPFVAWSRRENTDPSEPLVVDLPIAGSVIDAHQPVCTVLAWGAHGDEVELLLRARIDAARRALYGGTTG